MSGPLEGVRVLEFGGIGPGPLCGMLLADLGASVVRIERPQEKMAWLSMSQGADILGRGKRIIHLDLRAPQTLAQVMALLAQTDVLLEGFRPGVMERLGLGPEPCLAANPALVYGRVTGYGQAGPMADKAGHDINYISLTGALNAIGTKDDPIVPLNFIGDYGGGALYLAMGVLAGVVQARGTGKGTVVDCAMVDGALSMMAMFWSLLKLGRWQEGRQSNLLDGGAPFYGTYRTKDGGHVAVGALEPQFFAELLRLLDMEESWRARQHDRDTWPEMREEMSRRFAQRSRDEWGERALQYDCCVTPVLKFAEVSSHPQIKARQSVIDRDGLVQPGIAPRFTGMADGEVNAFSSPIELEALMAAWGGR